MVCNAQGPARCSSSLARSPLHLPSPPLPGVSGEGEQHGQEREEEEDGSWAQRMELMKECEKSSTSCCSTAREGSKINKT